MPNTVKQKAVLAVLDYFAHALSLASRRSLAPLGSDCVRDQQRI